MENALKQADKDLGALLDMYSSWKFRRGETHYITYDDLVEFVNARLETVRSCKLLLADDQVSDTMALNRSLLENYLMYMLVCRGTKYFRLRSVKGKSEQEIEKLIKEELASPDRLSSLLDIRMHPKLKKTLMYVFKGLESKGTPSHQIAIQYFNFKNFNPETFRLNADNYFKYHHQRSENLRKKRDEWKEEQKFIYRNYVSYDALLQNLKLNDMATDKDIHRIEAHYTFLGKFVHPTVGTFQELRHRDNHHTGEPVVGFEYPYKESAKLLAYCYTIHNALNIVLELIDAFKIAPGQFIAQANSKKLEDFIERLKDSYSYFWYIFNGPSLYDKYAYALYNLSQPEFEAIGSDPRNVDPNEVMFNHNIFHRFENSISSLNNLKVGSYKSPLL